MTQKELERLRYPIGPLVIGFRERAGRFNGVITVGKRWYGRWIACEDLTLWIDPVGGWSVEAALTVARDFALQHGIPITAEAGQPCAGGGVGCRT